jgi:hypothetical protein
MDSAQRTSLLNWCQKLRKVFDASASKRQALQKQTTPSSIKNSCSPLTSQKKGGELRAKTCQKKGELQSSSRLSTKGQQKQGLRWCPGVMNPPSKPPKKLSHTQMRSDESARKHAVSKTFANRYVLLATEEPEAGVVHVAWISAKRNSTAKCSADDARIFKDGRKANRRGGTPAIDTIEGVIVFLQKFKKYCQGHRDEMASPYKRTIKALTLLHEDGVKWVKDCHNEMAYWTLGMIDPDDPKEEVLWTKFKIYLASQIKAKEPTKQEVEKEKAQITMLKALAVTMTKGAKQGSSPLEKKELQAKLPALLPPKEGCSPQEQAEQERKFAKALTRAVIGIATAKRWRDGLPSKKKKAEGQRGSTPVKGPVPCDPGRRRTYAEALTACKERWTRHKQGKEDIFTDLPFAGQTEDPVEARKAIISDKKNALVIPITFANLEGVKEGVALVDSGATECFIDMKTAQ